MIPIAINRNRQFDADEFKTHLTETCRNHKNEGIALAFAFIVYDFSDHTITEMIEKKNYMKSLDKVSGDKLSIFYINSQDKYYQKKQMDTYLQKKNSNNDGLSFLVSIDLEQTPIEKTIEFIKTEFDIGDNINTPFVMFFQIDSEENISDSFFVQLKKEKFEDSFLELKHHIQTAVRGLQKVLPECYDNYDEIFQIIKDNIENKMTISSIRKLSKKIKPVSLIKYFISGY